MPSSKHDILVITYWSFRDALIQRYTLPYLHIIKKYIPKSSTIYLVTMENAELGISGEEKNRIKDTLKREGIELITFKYSNFGLMALVKMGFWITYLAYIIRRDNIKEIHPWCMPAAAIAYILSCFSRTRFIIDSFEPHAETMVESKTWRPNSISFKLLFSLEKLAARRAETVIATTDKMREYAKQVYQTTFKHFYLKPACVDFQEFSEDNLKKEALLKQLELEDKIVCVYAGKFGGSYLQSEVFQILKEGQRCWGNSFRALLLNNQDPSYLKELAQEADFDFSLVVHKYVEPSKIPDYLGLGDFGLTPFVPVPSKRYGSPIKTGEYLALGLPIIITKDISDDSDYIEKHKLGHVLKNLENVEISNAIKTIDSIISNHSRQEIYKRIRPLAISYRSFDIAHEVYRRIYEDNK